LLDNNRENPEINLRRHALFQPNAGSVLLRYGVPKDLDYLSSDMDSHDIFVLHGILQSGFRPRIVSTEYNGNFDLNLSIAQVDPEYLPNNGSRQFKLRGCLYGASAAAWRTLMTDLGYTLVGISPRLDLFWIRNDLIDKRWLIPPFERFFEKSESVNGRLIKALQVEIGLHSQASWEDFDTFVLDYDEFYRTGQISSAQETLRKRVYFDWQQNQIPYCLRNIVSLVVQHFEAESALSQKTQDGEEQTISMVQTIPRHGVVNAALSADPVQARLKELRAGCREICDTSSLGVASKFYPRISKKVDCAGLWGNAAIDKSRPPGPPPEIPASMLPYFLYDGRVKLARFSSRLLNQQYMGNQALLPVWTEKTIEDWKGDCGKGKLHGAYGRAQTGEALKALKMLAGVQGGHVLVIGSERPWLEACALHAGASMVTTIEYGAIKSDHPQVTTLTPAAAREAFAAGKMPNFDAVATFSSLEHSGLGRYGDELNPWGDLQAFARAWCVTKPGGGLLIAVPGGTEDSIQFNAHRLYGPTMLSHLTANYDQEYQVAAHHYKVNEGHLIFTLRKGKAIS
jgi:hypothetical protein